MKTQIDHLVVVAHTLEQGTQWCETTIGITPGPGGEHPQHGTHNCLFKIATPANPFAYLEIIAINPGAKRTGSGNRWFDMDDPAVQAAVALEPRLLHFVVNTDDIRAGHIALQELGIERGPAMQARRVS
ncbi:VOC family protein [bacterium]|nr:VOC family protein [bacterium]